MRIPVLAAMIWLFGQSTALAVERSVVLAGMDVTVWSKGMEGPGKQPVIIFSHGFHGCATQSRFLTDALASAGYVVFAPNHLDATCNGGQARWIDRPNLSFRRPEIWNEKSYQNRAGDIHRLIEAIRADDRFRDVADLSRLGLAGHSLGGYTVLGLGGAWPSWKLKGVRAVLALSPYTLPFIRQNTLNGLSAPVMYQGGTWDFAISPAIRNPYGSYDLSPSPKYYVEFDKAGHFAWADIGMRAHEEIVAYSLAFMNHYVKGDPADALLRKSSDIPGVALYRYASELGSSDEGNGGVHSQN